MPVVKVATAQDAIERAAAFLERYWIPVRPLTVKREGAFWVVTFEVGVPPRPSTVRIGAKAGQIKDYVVSEPERPSRAKKRVM